MLKKMNGDIAIKVENLSKVFSLRQPRTDEEGNLVHQHYALKDVSFEIKKGESVGVIGPNGSGKSTLIKILAGVIKPTSGEVKIRGKVASILEIGAGFHPELSGRDNVFLNGQILGFSKKEVQQYYDEIVEFSEIEKFIDEPVKNYSNGMYLRLAFSIMAHLDFDVYLFDEVFSVGDAEFNFKTKFKLQELLDSEKTIIRVSHNPTEVSNMDKYIHMEKGRVKYFSSELGTLSNYIESSLLLNLQNILVKNASITDFSRFQNSSEIKMQKVQLMQQSELGFTTDKAFLFSIEFEKLTDSDSSIDLAVLVNDVQGNVILSTNPLLSGFPSNSKKGKYTYTCLFPPSIFGFQVYRIGLFFTKNTINTFRDFDSSISISDDSVENLVHSAYRMDDLIAFKPQFKINGVDVINNKMSISGGLLPIFEWDLNFEKNEPVD